MFWRFFIRFLIVIGVFLSFWPWFVNVGLGLVPYRNLHESENVGLGLVPYLNLELVSD